MKIKYLLFATGPEQKKQQNKGTCEQNRTRAHTHTHTANHTHPGPSPRRAAENLSGICGAVAMLWLSWAAPCLAALRLLERRFPQAGGNVFPPPPPKNPENILASDGTAEWKKTGLDPTWIRTWPNDRKKVRPLREQNHRFWDEWKQPVKGFVQLLNTKMTL